MVLRTIVAPVSAVVCLQSTPVVSVVTATVIISGVLSVVETLVDQVVEATEVRWVSAIVVAVSSTGGCVEAVVAVVMVVWG